MNFMENADVRIQLLDSKLNEYSEKLKKASQYKETIEAKKKKRNQCNYDKESTSVGKASLIIGIILLGLGIIALIIMIVMDVRSGESSERYDKGKAIIETFIPSLLLGAGLLAVIAYFKCKDIRTDASGELEQLDKEIFELENHYSNGLDKVKEHVKELYENALSMKDEFASDENYQKLMQRFTQIFEKIADLRK